MFLAAWRNANDISAGKEEEEKKERMKKGGSGAASMRERRVEKGVGGGRGCNKAENEERQKRIGAGGGQAHHRLQRCLQGCLGQVAAPDNLAPQSSILSGGDKGFLHPSFHTCSSPPPRPALLSPSILPSWGISQPEAL